MSDCDTSKLTDDSPKNPCPTVLLSDEPADTDEFGSHERVAKAIAHLIGTEQGGKSIALTGPWGSGKSTVVKLVQQALSKTDKENIRTFVFNAWDHEGDPLRRAFLEQLIDFLKGPWIPTDRDNKNEYWDKKKAELAKRYQEITTSSEPYVTTWGKVIGLAAFLVPVGYILLSKWFALGFSEAQGGRPWWPFVLGGVFTCAPLLVLLFFWLRWRPTLRFWDTRFWTEHRAPHEKDSLLGVFINKTRETTKSETIRTPDPTSIEFQSTFAGLMHQALADEQRRLLIAIDNLDRVDPEDALTVWATMRTFIDIGSGQQESWAKRLWLLVPYDPTALGRLWRSEGKDATELQTAFAEKTFQIRFEIAEPVVSRWQEFMRKRLAKAFPSHEDQHPEDFDRVIRIYRYSRLGEELPPTPRDMKLFVNRVGALYRQWGTEIPMPQQALYVMVAGNTVTKSEDLLKAEEGILGKIPVYLVGAGWRESLADMHLNVGKEGGLEVLMGPRVEKWLISEKGEAIREIENLPGFPHVLETIVEDNARAWAEEKPRSIVVAANRLAELTKEPRHAWTLLCTAAARVEAYPSADAVVGEGMVRLLQHQATNEFAAATVRSLRNSFPGEPQEGQTLVDLVRAWVDCVDPVLGHLKASSPGVLESSFSVPGAAAAYIVALRKLAEKPSAEDVRRCFTSEESSTNVLQAIAEVVGRGEFDEHYVTVASWLADSGPDWPWTTFVDAVKTRLGGTASLPEAKACIRSVLELRKRKLSATRDAIKELVDKDILLHQLDQARKSNEAEPIALCMLPLLEGNSDGSVRTPSPPGNAVAGADAYKSLLQSPQQIPALAKDLAGLVIEYGNVETLFTFAHAPVLVGAALDELVGREDCHALIPPKGIIERCAFLKEALSEPGWERLLERSAAETSLLQEVVQPGFNQDLVGLYRDLHPYGASDDAYQAFLVAGLGAIPQATWESELDSKGKVLQLLISVVAAGGKPSLSTDLSDALRSHADKLLTGQTPAAGLVDEWPHVLGALDDSARTDLLKSVRDRLCRATSATDSFLILYGDELLDAKILTEKADELVRELFKGFIDRGRKEELAWLHKAVTECPQLLEQCPAESLHVFNERVSSALRREDLTDEARDIMEKIAQELGAETGPANVDGEEAAQEGAPGGPKDSG